MPGFLERLFGKRPGAPLRDVAALTASLAAPALHLRACAGPSRSHLGGQPNLPTGIAWPQRHGKRLGFLARLSLPQMQQALPIPWLPESGALLFFYDLDEQPWGFDPRHRDGHAVLYVPDLETPADAQAQAGAHALPLVPVEFRAIAVLPAAERVQVEAFAFSDAELDRYCELAAHPYEGLPRHQVAGFPDPQQGDSMELECQLASNGIDCGTPEGYQSPDAARLAAGAGNWKLLFQFDSDDTIDAMWGDDGMLYFWIEEHRARARQFDRTWLVLQCG